MNICLIYILKDDALHVTLINARINGGLSFRGMIKKKLSKPFSYPTKDKWFVTYGQLESILRLSDDVAYRNLPSHVAQNVIRKVCKSWIGYFASLKSYNSQPSLFTGCPGIPGYRHDNHATLWYSNQVSKVKSIKGKLYLELNDIPDVVCIGNENDFFNMKYVKTEIKYRHGAYVLFITYEDKLQLPEASKNPSRIYGIDVGIDNLMSVVGNFKMEPFIVKGLSLKSANRYFNKKKASKVSMLMKNRGTMANKPICYNLETLSEYRFNFIRDYLYKACHAVCRKAKTDKVSVIVIGHNQGQKDKIALSKAVNQSFVSIPFLTLVNCLILTAAKYGIAVISREESYTSKASLLDMDPIPEYGHNNNLDVKFQGKRVHRGQYRSKDGIKLNADINAAGNIARKEYSNAFKDIPVWASGNVRIISFKDLYTNAKKKSKSKEKRAEWYKVHHPHANKNPSTIFKKVDFKQVA